MPEQTNDYVEKEDQPQRAEVKLGESFLLFDKARTKIMKSRTENIPDYTSEVFLHVDDIPTLPFRILAGPLTAVPGGMLNSLSPVPGYEQEAYQVTQEDADSDARFQKIINLAPTLGSIRRDFSKIPLYIEVSASKHALEEATGIQYDYRIAQSPSRPKYFDVMEGLNLQLGINGRRVNGDNTGFNIGSIDFNHFYPQDIPIARFNESQIKELGKRTNLDYSTRLVLGDGAFYIHVPNDMEVLERIEGKFILSKPTAQKP